MCLPVLRSSLPSAVARPPLQQGCRNKRRWSQTGHFWGTEEPRNWILSSFFIRPSCGISLTNRFLQSKMNKCSSRYTQPRRGVGVLFCKWMYSLPTGPWGFTKIHGTQGQHYLEITPFFFCIPPMWAWVTGMSACRCGWLWGVSSVGPGWNWPPRDGPQLTTSWLDFLPSCASASMGRCCHCSVAKSCPTLCDPMNCHTSGSPVLHHSWELAQTHVHWVSDVTQPSHRLLLPSPFAFTLSQHQGLFQWVDSSYQGAKVLEFQLQHQSFQWIFGVDFL